MALRQRWLSVFLWLGFLGSLGLEVYLLERNVNAHRYYWQKVAGHKHKQQLYQDTPLVSSSELLNSQTDLGKTVRFRLF